MVYDEKQYWETRYRSGGISGPERLGEQSFLVERSVQAINASGAQSILDVGIGDGSLAALILAKLPEGVTYRGVDITKSGLDAARRKIKGVSLKVADAVEDALDPADLVLCFNVHYHIASDERAVTLIKNLLTVARKAVLILTWNQDVLQFGNLAPHCHYRPLQLPEDSEFELQKSETIPSGRHKTLYTLVR